MEATREHRGPGDMEVGYADILQEHVPKHAATHAAPPAWLTNWEDKRPRLLTEMFAEFLGVFIYTYCGVGATAAFFISTAAKEAGFGSLLTIGLAYGLGIILAIILCGPASGGHLSPCFTIAFWLFKGFPLRKVPFYIIAQIAGGFIGILVVQGVYNEQLSLITQELSALAPAQIFTPTGTAGVLALFPQSGQSNGYLFFVEFMATTLLGIVVFSVLDPSNLFISFATAPFVIGFAYSVIVWCYAIDSISLNTARDLGGRMACAVIHGRACFNAYPSYTAIAALVNIPGTIFGALIQTLLLSDSARPLIASMPNPEGPTLRAPTREAPLRAVSRETGYQYPSEKNGNGVTGNGVNGNGVGKVDGLHHAA